MVVGTVRNLVRALSPMSAMLVTTACKTPILLPRLSRLRVKLLISWEELSQWVTIAPQVVSAIEVPNSQDLAHQVNTTAMRVRTKLEIVIHVLHANTVMVCLIPREPTF
jgi:hypothetical protein